MGAVIGVRCRNTEAEDTTRTCLVRRRSRRSSCGFSKTTCGWTEAPERSFSTSPSTTATSTSSASPSKNHQLQHVRLQCELWLLVVPRILIYCTYLWPPVWKPTVQIMWCFCQVAGGVPGDRWGGHLLAVPNGASDTICVQLGLLCGSVCGGVLPLRLLLRGGGGAGDPHPPSALLQEPVELPGCSHRRGVHQTPFYDHSSPCNNRFRSDSLSLWFTLSALFSVECCRYYHEHNQDSHGWQPPQRPAGEPLCSPQLWVFGQPAGPVQQRGGDHRLLFLGQGINLFPFAPWSVQNCHSAS